MEPLPGGAPRPARPSLAVCLLLALACMAAAASCGDQRPAGPPDAGARRKARPLRIPMIAKSSTNPSFLASRLGAERRARELSNKLGRPIEVEWLTPPQEDGAVQAQRVAQAVSGRADAILLSCSDAK